MHCANKLCKLKFPSTSLKTEGYLSWSAKCCPFYGLNDFDYRFSGCRNQKLVFDIELLLEVGREGGTVFDFHGFLRISTKFQAALQACLKLKRTRDFEEEECKKQSVLCSAIYVGPVKSLTQFMQILTMWKQNKFMVRSGSVVG